MSDARAMQRELITFEVEGQSFAIDIMSTREIRAWTPVTRLPNAPPHIAGVVNLRGTVLPVIDLAARLGWKTTQATARHAIIVVQVGGQAKGLIVDSVSDIVTMPDGALQAPPVTSNQCLVPFLEGLAPVEERMIMLLNLGALCGEEIQAVAA